MHGLLNRLLNGAAGREDLQRLEALCNMVRDTSLCGLGQTAPNPTLSTLRYFREEYESLLRPGLAAQRMHLNIVTVPTAPPSGNGQHSTDIRPAGEGGNAP